MLNTTATWRRWILQHSTCSTTTTATCPDYTGMIDLRIRTLPHTAAAVVGWWGGSQIPQLAVSCLARPTSSTTSLAQVGARDSSGKRYGVSSDRHFWQRRVYLFNQLCPHAISGVSGVATMTTKPVTVSDTKPAALRRQTGQHQTATVTIGSDWTFADMKLKGDRSQTR